MEAQLQKLGLAATRISAVTPQTLPPEAARYVDERRYRWVSKIEAACTYSHRKVWRKIVDEGHTSALVLEDDSELSQRLPGLLLQLEEAGKRYDVVRIETRIGMVMVENTDEWLRRFYSLHTGTCGYVVSLSGAKKLLAYSKLDVPVDQIMFDPYSPMFHRLKIVQTVPALCAAADVLGRESAAATPDVGRIGAGRYETMMAGRRTPLRRLKSALIEVAVRVRGNLWRRYAAMKGAVPMVIPLAD